MSDDDVYREPGAQLEGVDAIYFCLVGRAATAGACAFIGAKNLQTHGWSLHRAVGAVLSIPIRARLFRAIAAELDCLSNMGVGQRTFSAAAVADGVLFNG